MDTVIKTNPDAATGKTASEINIDVIQGIIKVVVADYIDSIIDATWESYAMGDWEYMDDGDGNLYGVIYTYDEGGHRNRGEPHCGHRKSKRGIG